MESYKIYITFIYENEYYFYTANTVPRRGDPVELKIKNDYISGIVSRICWHYDISNPCTDRVTVYLK